MAAAGYGPDYKVVLNFRTLVRPYDSVDLNVTTLTIYSYYPEEHLDFKIPWQICNVRVGRGE